MLAMNADIQIYRILHGVLKINMVCLQKNSANCIITVNYDLKANKLKLPSTSILIAGMCQMPK